MERAALSEDAINVIQKLEKIRGTPILLLSSVNPLTRENASKLDKMLRDVEQDIDISVILNSGGGDIDAAYKITNTIRAKFNRITILIPEFAKSAATLIALGADEIFMSPNSELGPLDALVQHPRDPNKRISALDAFKTFEYIRDYLIESFDKAVFLMVERGVDVNDAVKNAIELVGSLCHPLYSQIDPIFMGESERTLLIAEEYGKRLLARKKGRTSGKEELILQIVRNYPSHSFVIDSDEAKQLGFNVKEMPKDQLELVEEIIEYIETDDPVIFISQSVHKKKSNGKEKKEEA